MLGPQAFPSTWPFLCSHCHQLPCPSQTPGAFSTLVLLLGFSAHSCHSSTEFLSLVRPRLPGKSQQLLETLTGLSSVKDLLWLVSSVLWLGCSQPAFLQTISFHKFRRLVLPVLRYLLALAMFD